MTVPDAMVREVQTRIRAGWTVTQTDEWVRCADADGATFAVDCGTVEDAAALVTAANA